MNLTSDQTPKVDHFHPLTQ